MMEHGEETARSYEEIVSQLEKKKRKTKRILYFLIGEVILLTVSSLLGTVGVIGIVLYVLQDMAMLLAGVYLAYTLLRQGWEHKFAMVFLILVLMAWIAFFGRNLGKIGYDIVCGPEKVVLTEYQCVRESRRYYTSGQNGKNRNSIVPIIYTVLYGTDPNGNERRFALPIAAQRLVKEREGQAEITVVYYWNISSVTDIY